MRSKSEQAKRQLRNPDGTFKYQGGRRTPDHDTLARYAAPQPTDLDEQELHRFLETRLDNVPPHRRRP